MIQPPSSPAGSTLLHASTRTVVSTFRDSPTARAMKSFARMTRMEIRQRGEIVTVRFVSHEVEVAPKHRRWTR